MPQISNTIDTASLVSQLMAVERIPQDQLKQRVSSLQTKQSAWAQIGNQITSMQNAADALAPVGSLSKLMTATSSADASIGVRVTGIAASSTSSIEVVNLATTHSMVSTDSFADAAASDGGRTLSLTAGGTTTSFSSTDGTIGGLVDAVNASAVGVRAKLLQTTGGNYQMILTATKSGAAANFTAGGSGWTGMTTATTGVDATVKVDGVTVKRASNIVIDLVNGVELTLKQPTASPVSVAVARDDDSVVGKVKAMVDATNGLIAAVKRTTATAATAAARGPLAGDSTAIALADSARNAIAAGITGTDGKVRPASTLGISLNRDGSIAFDEAKLRASLTGDPAGVTASLGRGGSSSIPGVSVTSVLSTSTPGPHAISITQIASASALVGVPVPAPPAGSTINMTVTTPNGTATVTFNAGASYAATAANLTLAMNRSGLTMEAGADGGVFSLTEKRPGSRNTFSVSGGSDLGLSGSATAGTDALATIDGTAVTGQGASIVYKGAALSVGVTTTQMANGPLTGTFQITDGLAGALSRVGGTVTNGVVVTAKSGLDSQVKDLQTRIDRYDDTLKQKEDLLKKKFASMDTVLTRLQGQMSSLNSFVARLG